MSRWPPAARAAALVFGFAAFALLCTANSAGYRYGASDQAFYIPAVLEELRPSLFPRDGALIASQARLTIVDECLAALVRLSDATLPSMAAALYVVSLGLLAFAGWRIGAVLYRSPWTAVALLAALTLRHAIARSGTNSLEPYFHPRQLAFALGALAVAAFLRGGVRGPVALVALAGAMHPTTAVWFALWIGVALLVAEPRLRVPGAVAGALAAVLAAWGLTLGPLAGRLTVMDAEWLATLDTKSYLFPLDWPVSIWALNLAYVPAIVAVYRARAAAGHAHPREWAIVAGALSLLLPFAIALPFIAARIALAVQLQTARIFWMLDFLAVVYVVWWMAEGRDGTVRRAQIAAAALALASCVRGGYLMTVLFPERPLAEVGVRDDDWGRAMAWLRATPDHTGVIAAPDHAARYGTSVRVAAHRDVLVEGLKDSAIGMYSRDVAMRTRERLDAIGGFDRLSAPDAIRLGDRYGLAYLVTEQPLALPIAFESGPLRVYRLGPDDPAAARSR
jgi:hypothetical protein